MAIFELCVGVIIGGAIMYYIQPPVKDFVTKVFAGAPAMLAKAQALQARAEALIAAAKAKATTSTNRNDGAA